MVITFQANVELVLIESFLQRDFGAFIFLHIASVAFKLMFLGIWLSYTYFMVRSLFHSLSVLRLERQRTRGVARQQAHWAIRIVRMEIVVSLLIGLTTVVTWTVAVAFTLADLCCINKDETSFTWARVRTFLHRSDVMVNAVGVALLSGVLWRAPLPRASDLTKLEEISRMRAGSSLSHLDFQDRQSYEAKAAELAGRGFRLRDLLDFWGVLLDRQVMSGFCPERSTTTDVVRGAIIPLSRTSLGGVALATKWNHGQPLVPQQMVTHAWSNTFANLTAAIVGDALGLETYGDLAQRLGTKTGLAKIVSDVRAAEKLDSTYWVCAFSINQHATICNSLGQSPPRDTAAWTAWDRKSRDSVTGERYPLCCCREPKTSQDYVVCEVNKFDTMMELLTRRVANGVAQLVVVDPGFDVLYRAWCVAEIVEGNILGIPARISVFSRDVVDENYERLSLLDVRDCEASVQSDKDMIISKIADIDVFNLRLQQLVFSAQGLFGSWLDGIERSKHVATIVKRSTQSLELVDKKMPKICCFRRSLSGDWSESASESETSCSSA